MGISVVFIDRLPERFIFMEKVADRTTGNIYGSIFTVNDKVRKPCNVIAYRQATQTLHLAWKTGVDYAGSLYRFSLSGIWSRLGLKGEGAHLSPFNYCRFNL